MFKAFFNRSKDWVDLVEMAAAGTLNVADVTAILVDSLGIEDERVAHVARMKSGA